MRAIALAVLVIVLPAHAYAEDYFPARKGAKWTYQVTDDGKKSTQVVSVADVSQQGTKTVVKLEDRDGDRLRMDVVTIADGFVLRDSRAGVQYAPALPLFKTTLSAGDRWKIKSRISDMTFDGEAVVLDSVEVQVPAGSFRAYRIMTLTRVETEAADSITVLWLAPDVGIVKTLTSYKGSCRVTELTKFNVNK